jgi:hypothetical protein
MPVEDRLPLTTSIDQVLRAKVGVAISKTEGQRNDAIVNDDPNAGVLMAATANVYKVLIVFRSDAAF